MGCVFVPFRLYSIWFLLFFSFISICFFLLLMFICHQCLCRFSLPFYVFQIICIVALSKMMQWREKCEKNLYSSEQMRHSFSNSLVVQYMRVLFCTFVETSCSHIDEHVYVRSAPFRRGFCTIAVCCHARKERRHCTGTILGLIVIQCEKLSPLSALLQMTHSMSFSFILSHSEIIGTEPLFCSIIRSCLLPFSEWQQILTWTLNSEHSLPRISHTHNTKAHVHSQSKDRDYGLHDDYDVNDKSVHFDYARRKHTHRLVREWTRFRLNSVRCSIPCQANRSLTKYCMMMTSFGNFPSHV